MCNDANLDDVLKGQIEDVATYKQVDENLIIVGMNPNALTSKAVASSTKITDPPFPEYLDYRIKRWSGHVGTVMGEPVREHPIDIEVTTWAESMRRNRVAVQVIWNDCLNTKACVTMSIDAQSIADEYFTHVKAVLSKRISHQLVH